MKIALRGIVVAFCTTAASTVAMADGANTTVGVISREATEPSTGGDPTISPPDAKVFAQVRQWRQTGACRIDQRDLAFFADSLREVSRRPVSTGDVQKFVRAASTAFTADCSSVEYTMASGVFRLSLDTLVCPDAPHPVVSVMLGPNATEGRGYYLELIDGRLSPGHDEIFAACEAHRP